MIREELTEEDLLKLEAETLAGEEEKVTCQNCNLKENIQKEQKDGARWKEKRDSLLELLENFWQEKVQALQKTCQNCDPKRKRNHGKTVFLQDLCTHLRTAKVGRNRGIRIATSGGIKIATLVI